MFPWNFMNLTCSFFQPFFTRGVGNTNGSCTAPIITGNPDSYYYSSYCGTDEDTVPKKLAEVRAKALEVGISTSSMSGPKSFEAQSIPAFNLINAFLYQPALEERDSCKKSLDESQAKYDKLKKERIWRSDEVLNQAQKALNEATEAYKKACNKVFLIERTLKVYEAKEDLNEYYRVNDLLNTYDRKDLNSEYIYAQKQDSYVKNAVVYQNLLSNPDNLAPEKLYLELVTIGGFNFEEVLDVMQKYEEKYEQTLLSAIIANEHLNDTHYEGKGELIYNIVMDICNYSPIKDSDSVKKLSETIAQFDNDNWDDKSGVQRLYSQEQIDTLNNLITACYNELNIYRKAEAEKIAANNQEAIDSWEKTIRTIKEKYANNESVLMGDLLSLEDRKKYLQEATINQVRSTTDINEEYDTGNGKFDNSTEQVGGTCWIHATLRSMMVTKAGSEYINSLIYYNPANGNIACYIPEADAIDEGEENTNGIYAYNQNDIYNASVNNDGYSIGDGDIATYIKACDDYWSTYEIGDIADQIHINEVKKGAVPARGFELITGKKAVFYQNTSKEIPQGVAYTFEINSDVYNNMLNLFNEEKAAFITGFESPEKVSSARYVDPNNHDKEMNTTEKPFISGSHAYSVVGVNAEYVYLEESNNPGMHIEIPKEDFIAAVGHLDSYRWG